MAPDPFTFVIEGRSSVFTKAARSPAVEGSVQEASAVLNTMTTLSMMKSSMSSTALATRVAGFDVQHIARCSQLVVRFDQQDIAVPCISRRACRQSAKYIDSIDLKDVSWMIDVTRLKHQESRFLRIDARAIK